MCAATQTVCFCVMLDGVCRCVCLRECAAGLIIAQQGGSPSRGELIIAQWMCDSQWVRRVNINVTACAHSTV